MAKTTTLETQAQSETLAELAKLLTVMLANRLSICETKQNIQDD